MSTPSWINKLKDRWQLKSVSQVIIVLIVFACTGFTVMFIKPYITSFLFQENHPGWFSVLYWVLIFPIYNFILLMYGFIFGQFKFFWAFEKRFFNRIFRRKRQA